MELFQEYQDQMKKLWTYQDIDSKSITKAPVIGHGMIHNECIIGFKELEKRMFSLQFYWLMKNYFIEWITQQ